MKETSNKTNVKSFSLDLQARSCNFLLGGEFLSFQCYYYLWLIRTLTGR